MYVGYFSMNKKIKDKKEEANSKEENEHKKITLVQKLQPLRASRRIAE